MENPVSLWGCHWLEQQKESQVSLWDQQRLDWRRDFQG